MKHSFSAVRVADANNSTTSNFSIRNSVLSSLDEKEKIPEQIIQKYTSEADILIESTGALKKVWDDMKKLASTQGGVLSDSNFRILFKKHSGTLIPLLNVTENADMFNVLDEDNDGFLNEDEQVLLFSICKIKMIQCSQKLLAIFDYKRFHSLMQCVRQLERNICQFQDSLRDQIYQSEIEKYHDIGNEKLEEFIQKYDHIFVDFEMRKKAEIEGLDMQLRAERETLEQELNSDSHMVKFKPKKELREFRKNEKLVALEERIEEATNYRKELEKISQKEANRLSNNMDKYITSKLKAFDIEADKKRKHLSVKLYNQENKLLIKMSRELEVLRKKKKLHENDIIRIQTMSKKKALNKGKNQGELLRIKHTLRKQNDIIEKFKKTDAEKHGGLGSHENKQLASTYSTSYKKMDEVDVRSPTTKLPSLVSERPKLGVKHMEALRRNPDLIRFYIKQKFGADIPVNAKLESYQQGDDQHHKIEKYLKGKSNEEEKNAILLCQLYDDKLEEIEGIKYSDSMVNKNIKPKSEVRTRITEMLEHNSKHHKI